jgi:hypothetical protein
LKTQGLGIKTKCDTQKSIAEILQAKSVARRERYSNSKLAKNHNKNIPTDPTGDNAIMNSYYSVSQAPNLLIHRRESKTFIKDPITPSSPVREIFDIPILTTNTFFFCFKPKGPTELSRQARGR